MLSFLTVCFLQVRVYFDFKIIIHCQGSVLWKRGNVLINISSRRDRHINSDVDPFSRK